MASNLLAMASNDPVCGTSHQVSFLSSESSLQRLLSLSPNASRLHPQRANLRAASRLGIQACPSHPPARSSSSKCLPAEKAQGSNPTVAPRFFTNQRTFPAVASWLPSFNRPKKREKKPLSWEMWQNDQTSVGDHRKITKALQIIGLEWPEISWGEALNRKKDAHRQHARWRLHLSSHVHHPVHRSPM